MDAMAVLEMRRMRERAQISESNVQEESNLLLTKQFGEHQKDPKMPVKASPEKSRHVNGGGNGCAWTANGLPLGQWSMMGEPIGLAQWEFSLLAMGSVAAILKFQCPNRAPNNQLIIQAAIRQFEEEVGAWADGNRCARTLKELRAFKKAGDLFTDEFFVLFQAVNRTSESLEEGVKCYSCWHIRLYIGFSVVAVAIAAPLLVRALARALAVPIGLVGKLCNMLWNNYERGLKGQKEIISSMQIGTFVAVKDLDNIRVLVDKFEIGADFAIRE
ncbi:hypothetical protein ACFX12_027612 [Malus domestica]